MPAICGIISVATTAILPLRFPSPLALEKRGLWDFAKGANMTCRAAFHNRRLG